MSNAVLTIGASGQGKTFYDKETFIYPNKKCLYFDVNNEGYTDNRLDDTRIKSMLIARPELTRGKIKDIANPKLPTDTTLVRSRFIGKIDEFMDIALKKRNTNVIIDEATIFFAGKAASEKLAELIVLRKHRFNNIILNFHAVRDVPPFLYSHINFIVLFKTEDNIDDLPKKAHFLIPYIVKLQAGPDHKKVIIPKIK